MMSPSTHTLLLKPALCCPPILLAPALHHLMHKCLCMLVPHEQ